MKKIVIGSLIVVAAAIAVVLLLAAAKPDTFSIQRSVAINAKPDRIAAQIIDFRKWIAWSPYEKYDPAMKRTFSGPGKGTGAVYEWKGNSDVGSGRMEILEVAPDRISIKLDFFEPMEGHNTAEFIFEAGGSNDRGDLEHARSDQLYREDYSCVYQHGYHGRERLRGRAAKPEGSG